MQKFSDLIKTSTAITEAAAPSQFAMHAMNKNSNGELVYTKVLFSNTAETIDMTTGQGFAYAGTEEFITGITSDGSVINETLQNTDYIPNAAHGSPAQNQTFQVRVISNNGVQYLISGAQNPTLTLYKGSTYTFDTSDSSTVGDPIYISTAAGGANYQNEYVVGVVNSRSANNGGYGLPVSNTITSAPLIFSVPLDAPSQLYYASGNNSTAYGILTILDAPQNTKYRTYNQVRFDNQQLNYYLNANGFLVARYGADYSYS